LSNFLIFILFIPYLVEMIVIERKTIVKNKEFLLQ